MCPDISNALRFNLGAAALCGLLLTDLQTITEEEYFCLIAGLSYKGTPKDIVIVSAHFQSTRFFKAITAECDEII